MLGALSFCLHSEYAENRLVTEVLFDKLLEPASEILYNQSYGNARTQNYGKQRGVVKRGKEAEHIVQNEHREGR